MRRHDRIRRCLRDRAYRPRGSEKRLGWLAKTLLAVIIRTVLWWLAQEWFHN